MQAIQKMDDVDAINDQGVTYQEQGKLADAVACFQQVLSLKPDFFVAYYNLGNAYYGLGNFEEAIKAYKQAVTGKPDFSEAYNNLGSAYYSSGNISEAIDSYAQAVLHKPDYQEAQQNLDAVRQSQDAVRLAMEYHQQGVTLQKQDKLTEAVNAYEIALLLKPDFVGAYNDLGLAHHSLSNSDEAINAFQQALGYKLDFHQAHNNLGIVYHEQGEIDQAISYYQQALALEPNYAEAHNNLGNIYREQHKLKEAEDCQRKALKLKPDHVGFYNGLGLTLHAQGRHTEAIAAFRKALKIQPDYNKANNSLMFVMGFDSSIDMATEQAEYRRWAKIHAKPLKDQIKPHTNVPDPDRKLRIGYVSADFRQHSASISFGPMILHHDSSAFDVVCYSTGRREDHVTERFRDAATEWYSTLNLKDDEFAELVRSHRIDILVDLSGHSSGGRLLMFARKPAPIQVTGWGYATGTGLPTMDYLMSDRITIPEEEKTLFAEQVEYLPCATGYMPALDTPEVALLPALDNGFITFGCLNRLEKISDEAFSVWAQILLDTPQTRLLLKPPRLDMAEKRSELLDMFSSMGITEDRIILSGLTDHYEHLNTYNQVDIALDPFPMGGGVSTMEALWMGVPVVALHGRRVSGRITPSILTSIGLKEFIANNVKEYQSIAKQATTDIEKLAHIRTGLRAQMANSEMGDPQQYVPAVERSYREMWKRWCNHVNDKHKKDTSIAN